MSMITIIIVLVLVAALAAFVFFRLYLTLYGWVGLLVVLLLLFFGWWLGSPAEDKAVAKTAVVSPQLAAARASTNNAVAAAGVDARIAVLLEEQQKLSDAAAKVGSVEEANRILEKLNANQEQLADAYREQATLVVAKAKTKAATEKAKERLEALKACVGDLPCVEAELAKQRAQPATNAAVTPAPAAPQVAPAPAPQVAPTPAVAASSAAQVSSATADSGTAKGKAAPVPTTTSVVRHNASPQGSVNYATNSKASRGTQVSGNQRCDPQASADAAARGARNPDGSPICVASL